MTSCWRSRWWRGSPPAVAAAPRRKVDVLTEYSSGVFLLDMGTPLEYSLPQTPRSGTKGGGMFAATNYPISIAETGSYLRAAKAVFSDSDRQEVINYLAFNPEAGDVIPGTGGVRKLRWALGNRGKSHGARIIYYFRDLNMPLYLLTVFSKNRKVNLNDLERNNMKQFVEELVKQHMEKKWIQKITG